MLWTDGQTDKRMDRRTDGWIEPITRPAFAKAMQVKRDLQYQKNMLYGIEVLWQDKLNLILIDD